MSKGYLWCLTRKYKINSEYYQNQSYLYPTKYLGRMTGVRLLFHGISSAVAADISHLSFSFGLPLPSVYFNYPSLPSLPLQPHPYLSILITPPPTPPHQPYLIQGSRLPHLCYSPRQTRLRCWPPTSFPSPTPPPPSSEIGVREVRGWWVVLLFDPL